MRKICSQRQSATWFFICGGTAKGSSPCAAACSSTISRTSAAQKRLLRYIRLLRPATRLENSGISCKGSAAGRVKTYWSPDSESQPLLPSSNCTYHSFHMPASYLACRRPMMANGRLANVPEVPICSGLKSSSSAESRPLSMMPSPWRTKRLWQKPHTSVTAVAECACTGAPQLGQSVLKNGSLMMGS